MSLRALLCCVCMALSAPSWADAHYTFAGWWPGQTDPKPVNTGAGFALTLPSAIAADAVFDADLLSGCQILGQPCDSVSFYIDAKASGLAQEAGLQAIVLSNARLASYYYFHVPAFSRSGSYTTYYDDNPGTLISVVPEPSIWILLLAALPLLLSAQRWRSTLNSE